MKSLIMLLLLVSIKGSCLAQILTESEINGFKAKMLLIANERNGSKYDALFSTKAFGNKYKGDTKGKEFLSTEIQSAKLGQNIFWYKSNKYEFLKTFNESNTSFVVYRLIGDEIGFNYHEMELCKENGVVKIADIYIYSTGETLSETLIDTYKTLLVQKNNIENKKELEEFQSIYTLIPQIKKLNQEGSYVLAYEKIKQAPEFVKKLRVFHMMTIMVTQNLSDLDIYEKAIDDFRKKFPTAKNLDMLLIDGYSLKKQYDKSMQAVNNLDKTLGGDPYLDYYRYLVSNFKNDTAASYKYIEKVGAAFPNYETIQLELLVNYKEANKEELYTKTLAAYKANKFFNQNKLKEVGLE
jgi:hypothetical protein